jgi:hypothetical protein
MSVSLRKWEIDKTRIIADFERLEKKDFILAAMIERAIDVVEWEPIEHPSIALIRKVDEFEAYYLFKLRNRVYDRSILLTYRLESTRITLLAVEGSVGAAVQ